MVNLEPRSRNKGYHMSTNGGNLSSKGSRNQEMEGTAVDRISDLPECLLLHILSFLSAVYVVRTSVLSRRWQNVWTGVPDLNFGEELVWELGGGEKSVNFVNRFLFKYKATSIHKFESIPVLNDSPDIKYWIRWAVKRNVQELVLSFSDHYPHLSFMPIFYCKTLVALKLIYHRMNTVFPPSACIPCLKTLELESVSSPDDEFEKQMISSFGMLENLYINRNGYLDPKKDICVYAQHIKRLKIKSCSWSPNGNICVIDINAPALEDLDIEDDGSCSLLLANVGNLSKAKFNLNGSNDFQSLLKCFSALKNVKSLHLTSGHTKQACNLELGLTFQNVNLTHLTVRARSAWFQLLPYFFGHFPNLQVLRLTKEFIFNNDYDDVELSMDPELLPTGLLSRLRVFDAEEFRDTEDELGILKYILKNANVLDSVHLRYLRSFQPAEKYTTLRREKKARVFEHKFRACKDRRIELEEKLRVAQKILSFPRASQRCKVNIS